MKKGDEKFEGYLLSKDGIEIELRRNDYSREALDAWYEHVDVEITSLTKRIDALEKRLDISDLPKVCLENLITDVDAAALERMKNSLEKEGDDE